MGACKPPGRDHRDRAGVGSRMTRIMGAPGLLSAISTPCYQPAKGPILVLAARVLLPWHPRLESRHA
jgi:hypothetical protein